MMTREERSQFSKRRLSLYTNKKSNVRNCAGPTALLCGT